jgi:large subunit ribosomal protein L29
VKPEDLRTLDADELSSRLKGARRELYELRFRLAVGQLDDHRQIRKVRKDIARILTVVHARRLGEAVEPMPEAVEAAEAVEAVESVEAVQVAGEDEAAEDAAPVAEAAAGPADEETPENVEIVVEPEPEQAPAPRKSRRRRAAGEVAND